MKFRFLLKISIVYFSIVVLFVLDRWLKYYFLQNPDASRDFFYLSFHLAKNYGIAFGILMYYPLLLFLIIGALILLVYAWQISMKHRNFLYILGLSYIILGTVSNLYDRLAYRYVIDYVDVPFFTIINIADVMIFFGVCAIFYKEIFIMKASLSSRKTLG